MDACATCASSFDSALSPISEKPLLPGRSLECCGRSICFRCLNQNKRYESYCPYCQITSQPSPLPQGLKEPPPYSSLDNATYTKSYSTVNEELPAYSVHLPVRSPSDQCKKHQPAEDVLHFVRPKDSIPVLALAYGVPVNALRKLNNIYSNHLIQARKTILIPGEYYKGGVSLSPKPEDEEEEVKKSKLRRWMMACKVAEYDVALLYLQQAGFELEAAIDAYKDDERWEQDNPLNTHRMTTKGKSASNVGMRRFVGRPADVNRYTR